MNDYNQREKRFLDAVALHEPDRVPIIEPSTNSFAYYRCGYTMAEVVYDLEKTKDAIRRYLRDLDIDSGHTFGGIMEGQGKINEKAQTNVYYWPGMPGNAFDDNLVRQFIEFPLLQDEDVELLASDITGALLTKALPSMSTLLAPLAQLAIESLVYPSPNLDALAIAASQPPVKEMFKNLGELGEMKAEYSRQQSQFAAEVEELGYPVMSAFKTIVAFDSYSEYLRGTMGAGADLYDHPDIVQSYLDRHVRLATAAIRANAQPDRLVTIPMHKGMDGLMSDEHYALYYWPYLMQLVNAIIDVGMVPYVYTEGPYYTRLKYLEQLPPGKCIVHIDEVDMATAKSALSHIACLSGNFPAYSLNHSTKQQVIDQVKALLDVCASGGGYIFDLDSGLHDYPPENVEAMFETVKEYGVY
ncbi:MAG: hypothetical protein FWH40_07940 [Coriobacteriia bacterium]|nr:hypothetical protein [Coriobacteriia bacterium]MCL2137427.1 hypothetical protein [Coriobacteriia bacterium]